MTNQCQDPTPEQEAMYAKDCEIAALREQIVEAHSIITACCSQDIYKSLFFRCTDWLDQNESIAKESAK